MGNKRKRRSFNKEFKQEVARLVTAGGRKVSEVARDLDIHPNIIHKWKREYLGDTVHAFPGKGRMKPEEEEMRKLRKTLADVTEERDILKKALAIFSKHPR
jgi:transposase